MKHSKTGTHDHSESRGRHREFLFRLAADAMRERGLEPAFSSAVTSAVEAMTAEMPPTTTDVRDQRSLLWCSIDNDDSRDLDQLTAAESLEDDAIKIYVGIADVSSRVLPNSPIDQHAHINTTSVYTPPRVFPMLPERLSTDLTSLNEGVDRLAIVVEAQIFKDGSVGATDVYRALVHNYAQLAYPSVGAWLEDKGPMPPKLGLIPDLADNLKLQDRAAQAIEQYRHEQGSLEFASSEVKAVFEGDDVQSLRREARTHSNKLIENFMVAANGVVANFLADHKFPVLRRVVKSPERWQRIIDIAEYFGTDLPREPDSKALQVFLQQRRSADPERFQDLSLSIIKLLGRGEYIASFPQDKVTGHFGLAVDAYTHSTAPNRRYPDLITQRLLHAVLAKEPCPLSRDELGDLAAHCTDQEDAVKKVERRLIKSAAALLLEGEIGKSFSGIVTGAGRSGTWVRVFDPPVEGRVERGSSGLDVGDRIRVKLLSTNPEMGFIDFERVGQDPIGKRRRR